MVDKNYYLDVQLWDSHLIYSLAIYRYSIGISKYNNNI